MIIEIIFVTLTVLLIVVSVIYYFALQMWTKREIEKMLIEKRTGKFPEWIDGFILFIFLDIIGIFASLIYLLFFRHQ